MPRRRTIILVLVICAVIAMGAALAVAGSQYGWVSGGVFSGIPGFAVAVLVAFVVQWIAYIPAAIARTDRYFDATGSVTYISVTIMLVFLSPDLDARDLILAGLVVVWAGRLGSFLLVRNIRSGGDDRFDEIKASKVRFFMVWTLQGLWISLTAAAAWVALASSNSEPLGWTTWLGLALWLLGFGLEVTADVQKSRFKADPNNRGRFIRSGLWSISRHPNYLGEILLWVGVFIIASPALQGWQWIALLSPVFVIFLLTKVSGIPMLEKKAAEKWGDDPSYREYRARTPALIPTPWKR